jgi:hypothetical protein
MEKLWRVIHASRASATRGLRCPSRDCQLNWTSETAAMALTLPPGLTPPEVAFLCEMELVTVIPRQRLEGLDLLGVSRAPHHIENI